MENVADGGGKKKYIIIVVVVVGIVVIVGLTSGLGLGLGLRMAGSSSEERRLQMAADPLHARIDCYPEARWSGVDAAAAAAATPEKCERRGCEYDPVGRGAAAAGVPSCFVSPRRALGAGYAAASVQRRPATGFIARLRSRAAAAAADTTIRPLNAVLVARYAGQNVLRLKV